MGNIKVARWNGLEILNPKHTWKSKIGHLEEIWGQNPYHTFFGSPCKWQYPGSVVPLAMFIICLSAEVFDPLNTDQCCHPKAQCVVVFCGFWHVCFFENFDIWHFTKTRRVCAGANPCAPVLPFLHLPLHLLLLPGGGHLYSVVDVDVYLIADPSEKVWSKCQKKSLRFYSQCLHVINVYKCLADPSEKSLI